MSKSGFPHLVLNGSPAEQGRQYGVALREPIREVWDFYATRMFYPLGLTDAHIYRFAAGVREALLSFNPILADEIEGMAAGARVDSWKVYALNARSELMNYPRSECTTVFFPETGILAQTWDWIEPLEEWAVLVTRHDADGRKSITFGEPGMVGKVGMNSSGLGMCLNFLFAPIKEIGVPLHCVAREPLHCTDFTAAKAVLQRSGIGKAGHLLLASSSGEYLSVEYAGDSRLELDAQQRAFVHTNHFIGGSALDDAVDVPGSRERFERARTMVDDASSLTLETAKRMLLDKTQGDHSINCDYHQDPALGDLRVGTIASIVMDLGSQTMHVKRGNSVDDNFASITL
ncbi:MAG: C45 family peptidase [Pseudomonadota bacterium]